MTILLDALGETGPFEGFVEADFAAFERKKWGSRVYTMERRAARQKLVALARAAVASRDGGLRNLEVGASDDAPSVANGRKVDAVWAYLTREKALRDALASRLSRTDLADTSALFDIVIEHQHASLLFRLDHDTVRIELHLSPRARVDRSNAATKLGYREDRDALVELSQALPSGARIGFEDDLKAGEALDEPTVAGFAESFGSSTEPFVVRVEWSSEEAQRAAAGFVEQAAEAASALGPILGHLAWSRDNDFAKVGVSEALTKAEKKLKKASPGQGLAPGTRVTILSGLFAGRTGYFSEVDAKGNAKVMVGPVSVSVPAADIKAG